MDSRKQKLLTYIIDAYIKTAQAVGSAFIADKYMKDVSGPTIRNWMQELEKDGYITHKHTSAGRVPTEKGYRYYLKNLHKKDISDKDQKALDKVHTSVVESDEKVKTVAKKIAELSGGAVVISFSPNEVYHTEQLDEVMTGITKQIDDEVSVLIGSDNPFGQECGVVLSVLEDGVVIGILGPMRMNYSQNVGLVKYIKYLLSV
jgi:heat-inducible transcriptional repressor